MLKYENECVSCPPEMGCIGSACPYRNVPRWYCDECEAECDREDLRILGDKQLCWNCFIDLAWDAAETPEEES